MVRRRVRFLNVPMVSRAAVKRARALIYTNRKKQMAHIWMASLNEKNETNLSNILLKNCAVFIFYDIRSERVGIDYNHLSRRIVKLYFLRSELFDEYFRRKLFKFKSYPK